MHVDQAPVKMMVVDGIYFGPKHCAHPGCADDLLNYCNGVFCAIHEQENGERCQVCNCNNLKIKNTQACQQHQPQWKKYVTKHKRQSASGFHKITQRPAENLPWVPASEQRNQPHDEPTPETEQKC